jgi:NTP pyrophosphatase (non-canonical NTP hydrolase)
MTEHFNKLTPAEDERLAMLAEECGEVIQIVSKIQRHGYDSWHPDDPLKTTNRAMLRKEVTDIAAVTASMLTRNDFEVFTDTDVKAAWRKKLRYAHHQEDIQ